MFNKISHGIRAQGFVINAQTILLAGMEDWSVHSKINTRCVCHISNTPLKSLLGRIKWVLATIAMLGTHVQIAK